MTERESCPPGAQAVTVGELLDELARQQRQFSEALASRDVIGQGKGILMERYGLTADTAFALMVRYSRTGNRPLREVAEDLVASRQVPGLVSPASAVPAV